MSHIISRLTAQGQISVPAEIRRHLELAPGSVLEWETTDTYVIVRKLGKFNSEEIHNALFEKPPQSHTLAELKEGIRNHLKDRYARD